MRIEIRKILFCVAFYLYTRSTGIGTKAGHDCIVAGKAIVATEDAKGRQAVGIVGLGESFDAVISNELSDHCSGDIGIGTKSEEGHIHMIVSVRDK